MTRAQRIALAVRWRRLLPPSTAPKHGCLTPMEQMLREDYASLGGLAFFIGEPISLAEKFRGKTMSAGVARRYFGVMDG